MQNNNSLNIMLTQGLGNQMFQYAFLLYMADKLKKQPAINISYLYKAIDDSQGDFELANFNLSDNIKISKFAFNNFTYKIYNIYFRIFVKYKKTTYRQGIHKQINHNTKYILGYFINSKYTNKIREKLLLDFVPKNKISQTASNFLKQIQADNNNISIHIRRGDYLNIKEFYNLDKEYYQQALKKLKSKGITGKIYIFSDDIKWCEDNLSDLGEIVFVKGTKNAFEDMWLMSKCTHNIIANSTFSWWGAWLNTNLNKVVVIPKKWNTLGDNYDKMSMDCNEIVI